MGLTRMHRGTVKAWTQRGRISFNLKFEPFQVSSWMQGIRRPFSGQSLQQFGLQRREEEGSHPHYHRGSREGLKMALSQKRKAIESEYRTIWTRAGAWSALAGSPGGGWWCWKTCNTIWFQEYHWICVQRHQQMYVHNSVRYSTSCTNL